MVLASVSNHLFYPPSKTQMNSKGFYGHICLNDAGFEKLKQYLYLI